MFGYVKRVIGLDCDFMAHINEKIEKPNLPTIPVRVTVAPHFSRFEDFVIPKGGWSDMENA